MRDSIRDSYEICKLMKYFGNTFQKTRKIKKNALIHKII